MTKLRLLPLLFAAFILNACVSASKFQAKETEARSQTQRADALDLQLLQARKDFDAGKKSQAELEGKLKAAGDTEAGLRQDLKAGADQLAGLQKSHRDLQDSLDSNKNQLSQKVSALIKDRDALQKERDALTRERDALAKDKDALSKERDGLSAEKGALTAGAEASAKRLAELGAQLAAAEAARKALEDAKAAELAQVKKSYEDLTSGLKSEISAGQVQITQLKGKLTVNMVDQILFDSGEASIKGEGKKVLEKVGALLNEVRDKDIRIEGHTDNKPITGALKDKYASNWELSTARATAVARHLLDHAKVDPKRVIAAGFGEQRPKALNDSAEGRAQNRRIEVVLVPHE